MTPEIRKPNTPAENPDVKPIIIDEDGLCPTCGYFAGSLLSCPRCGARVENRITVRFVKIASIVGSVVGILILWLAAHLKEPKLITIASIDERMNGAYVKVVGKIVAYMEDAPKNTLKLRVDDGSGQLTIHAFNKLAIFKKIHEKQPPEMGDTIEVAGTVSETQKFGIAMFLPVPERLKVLQKLDPKEYHVAEINNDLLNEIVKIRVFVSSYEVKSTRKGTIFHTFTLSDETGGIGMVLFDTVMEKIPEETRKLLFEKGNELEMVVKISEYQDAPQASLFDYTKVKKVGTVDVESLEGKLQAKRMGETKANKFKKLGKKDIGKFYLLKGTVKQVRQINKGTVVTLDDGTGEMGVVLWESMKSRVKGIQRLKEGASLSGIFQIGEYRDDIQLKISRAEDIRIEGGKTESALEIIQDETPTPKPPKVAPDPVNDDDSFEIMHEEKPATTGVKKDESSLEIIQDEGAPTRPKPAEPSLEVIQGE
ncbi:MAG TPA: hypothetical protein PK876_07005 [Elusimicrobiota bacterium]|nr:hypothetical protein [Elusimicrobiota bacterium]